MILEYMGLPCKCTLSGTGAWRTAYEFYMEVYELAEH